MFADHFTLSFQCNSGVKSNSSLSELMIYSIIPCYHSRQGTSMQPQVDPFSLVSSLSLSVTVSLTFFLRVCCPCACMLYAQALSTPCPSILQGVQSGKGKRPATTRASTGSSACSFSCNNEIWECKSTTKKILQHFKEIRMQLHLNHESSQNVCIQNLKYFYFTVYRQLFNKLLTTLGAKNTVIFLHFVKSTCDEIQGGKNTSNFSNNSAFNNKYSDHM